jgi:alcohol dehydrogenase
MLSIRKNEYFGEHSIGKVSSIVDLKNAHNILLVTGKKSYQRSGLQAHLEQQLQNKNLIIVNDFQINPKYDDICRLGKKLKYLSLDLIIAGGGGSVIDFAKCLNVYLSSQDGAGSDGIIDPALMPEKFLPMIAIPTTAGTGSEATHFAVAYVNEKKISVAHKSLVPDYAIIDPMLCYASPEYISACCAFDALSQAIESLWSVGATAESKIYAEQSILLLKSGMLKAIKHDSHEARADVSMGAFLSGKAINLSKTTAPHALSYALTSKLNIPHGHAVALTLGHFLEMNDSAIFNDHISHAIGLSSHLENMKIIKTCLGWLDVNNLHQHWSDFMNECGLIPSIKNLDTPSAKLDDLVDAVNIERLNNHPIKIDQATIRKIYTSIIVD